VGAPGLETITTESNKEYTQVFGTHSPESRNTHRTCWWIPGSRALPAPRNDSVVGRHYTNFTFFSGRLRTGLPVAAKMALSTAGATTLIVGSPTPPQKS
jgi:hypothetical protein